MAAWASPPSDRTITRGTWTHMLGRTARRSPASGATASSSSSGRPRPSRTWARRCRPSPCPSSPPSCWAPPPGRWACSPPPAPRPSWSIGLFAGVWVDRLRRRPVMIAADVARAVLLLAIPLASALGVLTIELLYAVALLAGALAVLFDVAFLSFIPSLVREGQLIDANSKLEMTSSTAQVAGPGLGGVLIGALGAPFAVLVDALSFLGSALFLLRTRVTEALPPRADARRRGRRDSRGAGRRRPPSHPRSAGALLGHHQPVQRDVPGGVRPLHDARPRPGSRSPSASCSPPVASARWPARSSRGGSRGGMVPAR